MRIAASVPVAAKLSIARLEAELATRLIQRTTLEVGLTEAGVALMERCIDVLARVGETVDHVDRLRARPRGLLRTGLMVTRPAVAVKAFGGTSANRLGARWRRTATPKALTAETWRVTINQGWHSSRSGSSHSA
jgi:hypothetical protein